VGGYVDDWLAVANASVGDADHDANDSVGAVFVMTDAIEKIEAIAYRRPPDGTLQGQGRFAAGGRHGTWHSAGRESPGPVFSNQNQLHVHIGALVCGGNYAVRIDVLESHGLIQPNRRRQHVVGLQIEPLCARIPPLIDRCMK
jgi:hypothetical protein